MISHALVGLASGKALLTDNLPKGFWFLSIVCPILPDADVLGFYFNISYHSFFGHRGFFHSPFFALLLSLLVVSLFLRDVRFFSKTWALFAAYFFVLTATHGLLDAFTSGGEGIALLSPFDRTRYFFPYTPIHVSPIGIREFFSEWGLRVILSEIKWIWCPAIVVALMGHAVKAILRRRRTVSNADTDIQ
jgi:inner membrane protein